MEFNNRLDLSALQQAAEKIRSEVGKVLIGQQQMVDQFLIALLSNGHVLVEGVPGIAKTLTAKLMAKTLSVDFARIQFTPDLMPSDVLGTSVYNQSNASFEFKQGPIFSQIVLIDEINRAPAKTQSALFEVMEERQITIDGNCYPMQQPFLVFATQNPVEQEGTYRLPEAQLDRFLFKINVRYPELEEEIAILEASQRGALQLKQVEAVLNAESLQHFQELVRQVSIEPELQRYIAQLVHQTRNHKALYLGASPRASLAIMLTAKARAALDGRDFVKPEDIREMLEPVLQHRILLTAEKEMEGLRPHDIIDQLVKSIEVPR